MRNLRTSDVFNALRVIAAAGMKDEVKRIALMVQQGKFNAEEVGLEFILGVIEKIAGRGVEKEFYNFIGNILEVEPGSIEEMDPMDLIDNIKELSAVIDADRWKNFFISVAKLMK